MWRQLQIKNSRWYLCIFFLSANNTKAKAHISSLKINSEVPRVRTGWRRGKVRSCQVLDWSEIKSGEWLLLTIFFCKTERTKEGLSDAGNWNLVHTRGTRLIAGFFVVFTETQKVSDQMRYTVFWGHRERKGGGRRLRRLFSKVFVVTSQ